MQSSFSQRIRFRFQKKGDACFLSHHDLMRLFERVVRRADVPTRMTSGFNPHPRISFPLALGLGIEAEGEVVEMELSEWMPANEVLRRISALMPAGLRLLSARVVSPHAKSEIVDITYEIEAPEGEAFWRRRAQEVMAAGEILVERVKEEKRRTVNIRPFLLDISAKDDKIKVRLKVLREGTARVEEILHALLGAQASAIRRRTTRSQVNLIDDEELRKRRVT